MDISCGTWKEKCTPRQDTLLAHFTYNVVVHCTYQKLKSIESMNIKLCTEAIKERRKFQHKHTSSNQNSSLATQHL